MAAIEKTAADARLVLASVAGRNVESQKAALEAALSALQAPGVAQIADTLLEEAGFVTRSDEEDATAKAAAQQQMMQQEQMEQEQAAQAQQQAEQEQAVMAQQEQAQQQQPQPQDPAQQMQGQPQLQEG